MSKAMPILLIAVAVLTGWLLSATRLDSQQQGVQKDNVKQLLQERLSLVEKLHDVALAGFNRGDQRFNFAAVRGAKVRLLEARLDLAETKEKRIKIHEEMVKDAAEIENVISQLAKSSRAFPGEELDAKIYRLERQIALERAK